MPSRRMWANSQDQRRGERGYVFHNSEQITRCTKLQELRHLTMGEDQINHKRWEIEGLLGLLVVLILVVVAFRKEAGKTRFPPGPFAWPVIGHLHLFRNLPHAVLRDVSRQYGHVLGLRLGQQRAVVVSSPELAKLVLHTHDKVFADRPPFAFTSLILFGSDTGLIFTRYGPEWRKHRKLCTLHLFTAKQLQELQYVRQEEINSLLLAVRPDTSRTSQRGAVDLGRCFGHMSCRIVMRLLQSRATTEMCGENLPELIKEAEQLVGPIFGDLVPYLSFLDLLTKQRMRHLHTRLDKVFSEMIKERKESACLQKMDLLGSLLSQEESLSQDGIKAILTDILAAGMHTIALTLEWGMAELLRNPHCLHRLQNEIDTQLGADNRQVSEADLSNLNYLKCVVKETLRLHPAIPLLVPHISLEECNLQGYTIPRRTLLFVNVWAIGRDEQVWPKASEFIPERFENKDVDLKGQHFELLPFGSGRRSCVGLPLALSVVETTLASLVSCFDWELPDGEMHASINMDEKSGITANKATPVIAIPKPRGSFSKLSDM